MEGFGAAVLADDYRQQQAELSQEFSHFGSDFKPIDPACYAPGGAPGCEFGGFGGADAEMIEDIRTDFDEAMTKGAKGAHAWATRPSKVKEVAGNDFRAVVANVSDKHDVTQAFVKDYVPSLEAWQLFYEQTVKRTLRKKGWSSQELADQGFGRMGVPAGMQLPGSWGVPDASMVRPGETPAGWDPNLFRGFGAVDKGALRRERAGLIDAYRELAILLRKATDKYHQHPGAFTKARVRAVGNRRNQVWKGIIKIQKKLGNKGLPFVAPVAHPWWNQ
jgi:hypothetical protein